MRSAPPRRRLPKALYRAAAWRCCAASTLLLRRKANARATKGLACKFSSARWRLQHGKLPRTPRSTAASSSPRMLSGKGNEGFDAGRKEYVDLIEAGIIDPTKVVRVALENAVSVASILLLTEATMTEIPEEPKQRVNGPEMAM